VHYSYNQSRSPTNARSKITNLYLRLAEDGAETGSSFKTYVQFVILPRAFVAECN
jgi:hypothetical protein